MIVPPANQGRCSFFSALAAGHQRADAGRVAEDLVERERDEIRFEPAQVERVGGREGGRVQQHIPAMGVGALDPFERMLDTEEKLDWAG